MNQKEKTHSQIIKILIFNKIRNLTKQQNMNNFKNNNKIKPSINYMKENNLKIVILMIRLILNLNKYYKNNHTR